MGVIFAAETLSWLPNLEGKGQDVLTLTCPRADPFRISWAMTNGLSIDWGHKSLSSLWDKKWEEKLTDPERLH